MIAINISFALFVLPAKSCPIPSRPPGRQPARLLCPWNFPGKNTRLGCHFFLQGMFPTQEQNPRLLRGQADSSLLSHLRSSTYLLLKLKSFPLKLEVAVTIFSIKEFPGLGVPWWLSGKESICQCRRHGLDPWSGKIPHATEQLSPCTTTTACTLEPQTRSY